MHQISSHTNHFLVYQPTVKDHKAMIQKAHDTLRPGGWAEFQEWTAEIAGEDPTAESFARRSALSRWCEACVAGGAALGRDFRAARSYKRWMVEVGFVDVVERQVLCPVSSWPLDPVDGVLGSWFALDVAKGVRGTAKLLEASGFAPGEVGGFMDEVCESVTHKELRAYSPREWEWGWE